jgi:adenylate cyclase
VLPFANMSGDPEQEYFSDGMTETLITDLSKISGLFVIARNSTFTYKGKAVKVDQIGRELGVRHVLEGSVQRAEQRVRINAQLIDVTTGGHVWADRYDRQLQDIFTLQDEITQKIAFALKVKLTPEEQERFRRAPTDNLEAYDYFLRGTTYVLHYTKDDNAQARQLYEKALELDPKYAGAYALLGFTYFQDWICQWSADPQNPERALELVQKAIVLNDSLSLSHSILGQLYLWKNRQHERALAELERAVALAPNNADAYVGLGWILLQAGKPEEAIEALEKSMRLDPHYPVHCLIFLGEAYYWLGRYEEAIAAEKKALLRNPDDLGAHLRLAVFYSEIGRKEEAQVELAESLRLSPNYSLEVVRQITPYRDPADLERVLTALRKAGLK